MVKAMPRTPRKISMTVRRPDCLEFGKSTCVMSPVTTALEPKPMRVRNIFICSLVVFCASSKITNESFSDRPRMKANGATSITFRSISLATRSNPIISYSASYMGRRYGSTFCVKSPGRKRQLRGKKAQTPPPLPRRPHQHDAPDFFRLQRLNRTGHGKICLARARRADAEDLVLSEYIDQRCCVV